MITLPQGEQAVQPKLIIHHGFRDPLRETLDRMDVINGLFADDSGYNQALTPEELDRLNEEYDRLESYLEKLNAADHTSRHQ